MNRDDLIQALRAHIFAPDRLGPAPELIFGVMDSPTQHVPGFSHQAVAGTRKLDPTRSVTEQLIEEIQLDLQQLSWGQAGVKYGIFVFWVKEGLIRYAKMVSLPEPMNCAQWYAELEPTTRKTD